MSSHISHSLARERQRDLLRASRAELQAAAKPPKNDAERETARKERALESVRGRFTPRTSR